MDYASWLSNPVVLPRTSVSRITSPANGATLKTSVLHLEGIAASPHGVSRVEVSPDQGMNWYEAQGAELWSFDWPVSGDGTYAFISRAIDRADQIETPGPGVSLMVNSALPRTSGVLTQDETWSGEVVITGDITVPNGVTLTIEAGTVIRFEMLDDDQAGGSDSSRSELIINGSLRAAGTETNRVVITSSSLDPHPGDWGGIRVLKDSTDGMVSLSHVTIEYATFGIVISTKANNTTVVIKSCTIQHNAQNGVDAEARTGSKLSLTVTDSLVRKNGPAGISSRVFDAGSQFTGELSGNRLEENAVVGLNVGIYDGATGDFMIADNTVVNNRMFGIALVSAEGYAAPAPSVVLRENSVHASGVGIQCGGYDSAVKLQIIGNEISQGNDGIFCRGWGTKAQTFRPVIYRNDVHDNSDRGIACDIGWGEATLKPEIMGNRVHGNKGDGIQCTRTGSGSPSPLDPLITLNTITANGGRGISCLATSPINVIYNDIRGNVSEGMYLEGGAGSVVSYNNLFGNGGSFDLVNGNGSQVDARCNFWGDAVSREMAAGGNRRNISRIFDYYDYSQRGRVDYANWLSLPVTLPGALTSKITSPADGSILNTYSVHVQGIAVAPGGVSRVEVSLDKGVTWHQAQGAEAWSYDWEPPGDGTYVLMARAIDRLGQTEAPGSEASVTIDRTRPTTSGALTHDESWSGEVVITGDVTVPSGMTLTIEPGAVVRFKALGDDQKGGKSDSRSELIVNGSFSAVGTAEQPIVFTSSSSPPARGDWGGILASGELHLEYVTVEYATTAIQYTAGSGAYEVYVKNSMIRQNAGDGINLFLNGTANVLAVVENNTVTGNRWYGFYCEANSDRSVTNLTICGNTFTNNTTAIFCFPDCGGAGPTFAATICDNTISDHTYRGIYGRVIATHAQITVERNTVTHCGVGIEFEYEDAYNLADSTLTVNSNTLSVQNTGIYVFAFLSAISPRIENNTIHHHAEDGIVLTKTGNYPMVPYLSGNQVFSNAYGVFLNATAPVTVINNGLYSNSRFDLYNNSQFPIDARSNWWGVETSNEMTIGSNPKNIRKIYRFIR